MTAVFFCMAGDGDDCSEEIVDEIHEADWTKVGKQCSEDVYTEGKKLLSLCMIGLAPLLLSLNAKAQCLHSLS